MSENLKTENKNVCRLCMDTETLRNIYEAEELLYKINFCVDVKFNKPDFLPNLICAQCENNVEVFYTFKQKCLDIDMKLRSMIHKCDFKDSLQSDFKSDCSINDNDYKGTLDSWFIDETNSSDKYFESVLLEDVKVNLSNNEIQREEAKSLLKEEKIKSKKRYTKDKCISIFQCDFCGNIYKTKSALQNHMISHTGLKPFSCKLCSKQFSRAENKVAHVRSHLGIKPYVCEKCGRSFTKRQDLVRHFLIHNDEKKFGCPQCDKRFKRSSDVKSHLRTHTGAKPYKCLQCNKCYTSCSGLRKHRKSHPCIK